jgi:hypothetical protein
MVLTLTQFVEAFFIAIMIIFLTSPQLLPGLHAGHQAFAVFNFF